MRFLSTGILAAIATLAAAAACGTGGESGSGGSGAANSGGSSAANSGGMGNIGFGGNGASSAGGTINVSGGSSGAGGNLGDSACATATYEGESKPLDMFVVYDRSGSMQGAVWDTVKQAFKDFVNSPTSAGIGMDLMFFPPTNSAGANCPNAPPCPPGCVDFIFTCISNITTSCNAADYLPPAVNVQPLPPVAQQIAGALDGTSPSGGTPTLPAMQAAVGATTSYAKTVPDRKVVIVLQTDGEPNDCNSDIPGVSAEAAKGVAASPSVQTYVIGIGNINGLNQIAQAGGTNQAIQVDAANPGKAFLDAMNAIRGMALSCEFDLPDPGAGQTPNPGQVNMRYSPDGTPPGDIIYNVPNVGACDPAIGGWYYNATQDQMLLCPASCDRIKQEQGRVDIELGCKTEVIPT